MKTISPQLIERMMKDQMVRTEITKQSHWYFFHFYFAHYVKYPTADFHNEIFELTENENIKNIFIVAFRGCGKSSLITTSYPIWAILGKQQKKFVLILSQTQSQAKQHMLNLKRELENNTILKNDLGPFKEESDEWGSYSLVFSKSNAKITAASSEQSIRGLRHNQYRPDLIIGDDVEDISSTKTRESRNKTHQWLTSEVIPAGDKNTRLIIVGNLLHEDSLLMRIKEGIKNKFIDGVFKEYPIIKDGKILWPGKYANPEEIETERNKIGNEISWQKEYMLKIVSDSERPIHPDWIRYYDELPIRKPHENFSIRQDNITMLGVRRCQREKDLTKYDTRQYHGVKIGIDLAISQETRADFTAMVPVMIFGEGKEMQIYVLPKIINKKITFPETVEICKQLNESYFDPDDDYPLLVVENFGYQASLPQQLNMEGVWNVSTIRPRGDKMSKLITTANMIKTGKILFPREGAKELISQIVNFGFEKHDDLADAFAIAIIHTIEQPQGYIGFV